MLTLDFEIGKKSKKPLVTKGRALSLYEVIGKLDTYWQLRHTGTLPHGEGRSLFYYEKVIAIVRLGRMPMWDVVAAARGGFISEPVYPPGYDCRCRQCDRQRVKRPRGPRPKKGQPLEFTDVDKYRGTLPMHERSKLISQIRERKKAIVESADV